MDRHTPESTPAAPPCQVIGLTDQGEWVGMPDQEKEPHLYSVGISGVGKTEFFTNLILDSINEGHGVIVIDPLSPLVERLLPRISQRLDDVIYWDLTNTQYQWRLNLLECPTPENDLALSLYKDSLLHVLERLWQVSRMDSPQLVEVIRVGALALMQKGGMTVFDLVRFLKEGGFRRQVMKEIPANAGLIEAVDRFEKWEKQRGGSIEKTNSSLNKIGEFTQDPVLAGIFSKPWSTVDIGQIKREGKILLVNLGIMSRGIPVGEFTASLVGTVLLSRILQATYMGGADDPWLDVFVDEFGFFASPDFAKLFDAARNQRVSVRVAHQRLGQMAEQRSVQEAAMSTGTQVVFRVNPANAEELGKLFRAEPQLIQVGTEPERKLADNIAEALLRRESPNETINRFVRNCLRPVHQAASRNEPEYPVDRRFGGVPNYLAFRDAKRNYERQMGTTESAQALLEKLELYISECCYGSFHEQYLRWVVEAYGRLSGELELGSVATFTTYMQRVGKLFADPANWPMVETGNRVPRMEERPGTAAQMAEKLKLLPQYQAMVRVGNEQFEVHMAQAPKEVENPMLQEQVIHQQSLRYRARLEQPEEATAAPEATPVKPRAQSLDE